MIDLINFLRVSPSTLVDKNGRCPLMYACGEGHLSICEWLIEREDVDYHRRDDGGRSCLIYACRSGHPELVKLLLPILSPTKTKTGWHAIHFATAAGHLFAVKILLQHERQFAHVITDTGHSVLYMAMHADKNNVQLVKYLLDSDPSIRLTSQDIQSLFCDESLILLLAQRRHSLDYLLRIIEKLDYPLPLVRLLLLSEHTYSVQQLLSIPYHQALICYHIRNPLKLKDVTRRLIRKSINTSNKIDGLQVHKNFKKFIRFEHLY